MRLHLITLVLLASFALVVAGCHSAPTTEQPKHYYYVDADSTDAAAKGQAFEDPSKLSNQDGATRAELVKYTKVQQAAKAEMEKNTSAENKAKYVDLTVDLANKTMYSPDLDPHEKYSGALKLFREALRVDPNNQKAKEAADTIVSIYNQMHRPVPQ